MVLYYATNGTQMILHFLSSNAQVIYTLYFQKLAFLGLE